MSTRAQSDSKIASRRDWPALARDIDRWGRELGFAQIGIADTSLEADEARLLAWLADGRMVRWIIWHDTARLRARPDELSRHDSRDHGAHSTTCRRMHARRATCLPIASARTWRATRWAATITRCCARKLQRLAERIARRVGRIRLSRLHRQRAGARGGARGESGHRLARQAHAAAHARAGSWFFLGEIYTDLPLPTTPRKAALRHLHGVHRACPTGAIVAPYELDARRCISYLTIELPGAIPTSCDRSIGNRVYGCDDCQLACPWNRYAPATAEPDFAVRHGLDASTLSRAVRLDAKTSSRRGCAAARSAASATSAGRAILPSASATPLDDPRSSPRSRAARTIHRRSCASTSRGRCAQTAGA
jgi:epoxyqueuosine reductase